MGYGVAESIIRRGYEIRWACPGLSPVRSSPSACVFPTPFCCQAVVTGVPPWWVNRLVGAGRSASSDRVRDVADPKCRCAGVGRPRWTLETPRSALPGPLQAPSKRATGSRPGSRPGSAPARTPVWPGSPHATTRSTPRGATPSRSASTCSPGPGCWPWTGTWPRPNPPPCATGSCTSGPKSCMANAAGTRRSPPPGPGPTSSWPRSPESWRSAHPPRTTTPPRPYDQPASPPEVEPTPPKTTPGAHCHNQPSSSPEQRSRPPTRPP